MRVAPMMRSATSERFDGGPAPPAPCETPGKAYGRLPGSACGAVSVSPVHPSALFVAFDHTVRARVAVNRRQCFRGTCIHEAQSDSGRTRGRVALCLC